MKYCLADQYAFGNFPLNETEKLVIRRVFLSTSIYSMFIFVVYS